MDTVCVSEINNKQTNKQTNLLGAFFHDALYCVTNIYFTISINSTDIISRLCATNRRVCNNRINPAG